MTKLAIWIYFEGDESYHGFYSWASLEEFLSRHGIKKIEAEITFLEEPR